MKKILFAAMILMGAGRAFADGSPTIWVDFGAVQVYVPFTQVSGTGLWDFVGKQSLIGAETPLASWKRLQFTGGAVTSLDGKGSPFLGVNLNLANPVENFVPLASLHPGVYGGRNFRENSWIFGVKASIGLF